MQAETGKIPLSEGEENGKKYNRVFDKKYLK